MPSSHPLPSSCHWFSILASVLDPRSAPRLAWLLVGAGLARGRRTVTNWVRAAGLSEEYRPCYTTVAAAGKRTGLLAAHLAHGVVKSLVADRDRLTFALDDTPTERYGRHVSGAGGHHNPTPRPAGGTFVYGHVWVVLVVTGTAVVGVAVGFLRPAVRLATIVLAALATRLVAPAVADAVGGPNGVPTHTGVFVGVTFVTALVILSVVVALLHRWFWEALPVSAVVVADGLRWLDRLAGAVVGASVAAAVVGTAVAVLDLAAGAQARGRLEGSATLRHARARFAGPAKAVTDDQKARLDEAGEWVKRSVNPARNEQAPPAPAIDR